MRRTLRFFLWPCLVAGLAFPLTAAARETRGKICGTVRDNAGVVPGGAALASNWQISGTWEYQPGALLDWSGQNIFHLRRLRRHRGGPPDA